MNIFAFEKIREESTAMQEDLIQIRRTLHQHPELGTEEHETDRLLLSWLSEWGISARFPVADTGIVATVEGKASPENRCVIGVRADIDALPLQENNDRPYCSLNPGIMHACGHDAHMTIALGTARYLKQHENEWSGCVKFFFQPAEETCGGADRMVQDGCMNNPKVDYVIGLHMMPNYECGQVELKYDDLNASSDEIILRLHGCSCHGAYPENGIDAILMSAAVIQNLQSLVSRNLSPFKNVVLSFGSIHGGNAANIISDLVEIRGTLRTTDPQTRAYAHERIKCITEETSKAFGGSAEVIIHSGYDALINTREIVEIVRETACEQLGAGNIFFKPFPSLGVEDFSFFLNQAPGAFYHLGCGCKDKGIVAPLHNADFDIDERVLSIGVCMQLGIIGRLLQR